MLLQVIRRLLTSEILLGSLQRAVTIRRNAGREQDVSVLQVLRVGAELQVLLEGVSSLDGAD